MPEIRPPTVDVGDPGGARGPRKRAPVCMCPRRDLEDDAPRRVRLQIPERPGSRTQHAAVRCFIRSRACDGTGDAGRVRSAAGRAVQRHQALACLPSPGPRRARAQVAGSRTLPSSTGSKDPHRQRTLPRLLAHLRFISQNESAGLYLRLSGAFDTDKGVKPGPPGSGVVNRRTSLFSPHFKARREIPDGLEFWGYITEYRLCCLLI